MIGDLRYVASYLGFMNLYGCMHAMAMPTKLYGNMHVAIHLDRPRSYTLPGYADHGLVTKFVHPAAACWHACRAI